MDCRFPKLHGVLLHRLLQWLDDEGLLFVAEEQFRKDPTKAHILVCGGMGNTNIKPHKQYYL
jgi:hypothetical protein